MDDHPDHWRCTLMGWDFWKDAEAYQERLSNPALNEGKTFFNLSRHLFHFTSFGFFLPLSLRLPLTLPTPTSHAKPDQDTKLIYLSARPQSPQTLSIQPGP